MASLLRVSLALVCCAPLQYVAPNLVAQSMATPPKTTSSGLPSSTEQKTLSPQHSVEPTEQVITIHGLCADDGPVAADEQSACDTTISKEGFETLLDAVDFNKQAIRPDSRKSFGETYAELLLFEKAGKQAGLEDTQRFREILRWLSLRTFADVYYQTIQEKYRTPTQSEIDDYYRKHLGSFETVKLTRIFVPKDDYSIRDKEAFARKAEEVANSAHERAAKGDDPEQIEKDVYASLGLTNAPATDMGSKRRTDLVPSEADEIFRLGTGQVTQIKSEPRSYVIYRVVSKTTPREDEVKAEISKKVTQENVEAAVQAVRNSGKIDFNVNYFGPDNPKPPQSAIQVSPQAPASSR